MAPPVLQYLGAVCSNSAAVPTQATTRDDSKLAHESEAKNSKNPASVRFELKARARKTTVGDTHEAMNQLGDDLKGGGAQPQRQTSVNMGAAGNGILRGQTVA